MQTLRDLTELDRAIDIVQQEIIEVAARLGDPADPIAIEHIDLPEAALAALLTAKKALFDAYAGVETYKVELKRGDA